MATPTPGRTPPPRALPQGNALARGLTQLAVILLVWVAAYFVGLYNHGAWNNIFLMGLVGTVVVVGSWEGIRWKRQERQRIQRRRRRRGLTSAPARRSPAAAAGRRRATMRAVGSLLIGVGVVLAWWYVMILVNRVWKLGNGYTSFLGLLGTMGLLAVHAHRRRIRKEQEHGEKRRAARPPIDWRQRTRNVAQRAAAAVRRGAHPARKPVGWAWKDAAALVLILVTVVIGALVLLASFASTPDVWLSP